MPSNEDAYTLEQSMLRVTLDNYVCKELAKRLDLRHYRECGTFDLQSYNDMVDTLNQFFGDDDPFTRARSIEANDIILTD